MAETKGLLNEIRIVSGLPGDDTSFDTDLLMYINTTLGPLHQVGALIDGAASVDDKTTWESIVLPSPIILAFVKLYVITFVRLNFDPPAPSTLGFMTSNLSETLWRLEVEVDNYYKREEDKLIEQ